MAKLTQQLARVDALGRQMRSMDLKKVDAAQGEVRKLFAPLCDAYLEADADTRIDIDIAFDGYDPAINELIRFFAQTAESAQKSAKKNPNEAKLLIRKAAAADAIISERGNPTRLREAQSKLGEAAKAIKFDLSKLVSSLSVEPRGFVARAMVLYKEGRRAESCKALGRALKLSPGYAQHDQVMKLAAALTKESPASAVATLQDSFLRMKLVDELGGKSGEVTLEATKPKAKAQPTQGSSGNKWVVGLIALLVIGGIAVLVISYFMRLLG